MASHKAAFMKKFEVSPCPLCRGTYPVRHPANRTKTEGWVYAGVESAVSMGVKCFRCGLGVEIRFPDKFPKNMPKSLKGLKAIEWLRKRTLGKAVHRWNKLPRNQKVKEHGRAGQPKHRRNSSRRS